MRRAEGCIVFIRAAVELNPPTVTKSSCSMYRAGPWGPTEGHMSFEVLSPSHQQANWGGTLLPGAALPSGQLTSQCVIHDQEPGRVQRSGAGGLRGRG